MSRSTYFKEWYAENKETVDAKQLKRNRENPEKYLLTSCKSRAKRKGIDFELTEKDINIPEVCPVFGTPLEVRAESRALSASVDRIDPSKGYIPGNVAVMSYRANACKNDMTLEDCRRLLDYMEKMKSG